MVKSVTIEGVQYSSPTAAAIALVASGKTITEAATLTGITYQTVFANTKGADKATARRAKYRVLSMGKTGKKSPSEIAKKCNLSVSAVVSMLKKNSITIVTKSDKKINKESPKVATAPTVTKAPKAPKAPTVAKAPKAPKAPTVAKAPKAPKAPTVAKAPKVIESVQSIDEDLMDIGLEDVDVEAAAMAAAMADMSLE
jgi:predicted transcriptional regulator